LDFNCSFLFIHNYTTHSYNLSPYIPMPEGRGITAMDGKKKNEGKAQNAALNKKKFYK